MSWLISGLALPVLFVVYLCARDRSWIGPLLITLAIVIILMIPTAMIAHGLQQLLGAV